MITYRFSLLEQGEAAFAPPLSRPAATREFLLNRRWGAGLAQSEPAPPARGSRLRKTMLSYQLAMLCVTDPASHGQLGPQPARIARRFLPTRLTLLAPSLTIHGNSTPPPMGDGGMLPYALLLTLN